MRNDLTDILASCLDSVEQGERTVEECLSLYPEHRNDLEPLLRTTAIIRERANFEPRPGFRRASRARLLGRLGPRHSAMSRKSIRHERQQFHPVFSKRLAVLWATILVLAVSLIGGGTVYASGDALPGDILYTVKLSTEDARLFFSNDTEGVSLAIEFVQIRMEEIRALIESDREKDLDLAVDLLSNRITGATEALATAVQNDPEGATQQAAVLEQALSVHTEVLTSQLGNIPDQAKPAIERAILASSHGQEIVQNMFEDDIPGGGPPEGIPGPGKNPPGGGPPGGNDPGGPSPGGGPPDGTPGSAASPPSGGPPDGVGGPPTGVPNDKPQSDSQKP